MTKDDYWTDDTFGRLRSRTAICSDVFTDELEEKMMAEFKRTPQRGKRRLTLAVTLAGLIGVGSVGGVAVGAYQDEIREWFYGPLQVDANGEIRNDDGELVGQALPLGEKKLGLQMQGESFVFETVGDGKVPTSPFSISIDSSDSLSEEELPQAVDATDFSPIKIEETPASGKE
jgi:hypothetical protein